MAVGWVENVQIHTILCRLMASIRHDITGYSMEHNTWVCVLQTGRLLYMPRSTKQKMKYLCIALALSR